jgi:toxin ParE1/3/4
MAKYYLTKKAVEDLNGIWEFTVEKWSEKQADKYYQLLLDTCWEIAEDPELGKNYDGVRQDLLGLKTSRHIIFYRKIDQNIVEISRILHGRMDLKTRIAE